MLIKYKGKRLRACRLTDIKKCLIKTEKTKLKCISMHSDAKKKNKKTSERFSNDEVYAKKVITIEKDFRAVRQFYF